MQETDNKNNTPTPPLGIYIDSQMQGHASQSHPQGRGSTTPSGGGRAIAPRVILGLLSGLLLFVAFGGLLAFLNSIIQSYPPTVDPELTFMRQRVLGAFGLFLAVPAIILVVFAVRPTQATGVAAVVALVLLWCWLLCIAVFGLLGNGLGIDEYLVRYAGYTVAFPPLSLSPALASVCVFFIYKARQGKS